MIISLVLASQLQLLQRLDRKNESGLASGYLQLIFHLDEKHATAMAIT